MSDWQVERIRQIVREELAFSDSRIHELEQCLQSFVDFVEKPTIAGNSFGEIMSYGNALRKKAQALLGYGQE